LELALR